MSEQTKTAKPPTQQRPPLWHPNIPIDVIGVTGEFGSGKTLFVTTIAPGPETIVYDFERSAAPYRSGLGFEYRDAYEHINERMRAVDIFRWFIEDLRKLPKGKFRVVAIDTIGDIEAGLADFVAGQYAEHGFKSAKAFESTGGIFWSAVKDFWKRELLAAGCETLAFTSHLRSVWKGGAPTSRKEPQGKSTMFQIASLYLWLDRSPDAAGKVPDKPSANVLKSRLAFTSIGPDGLPVIVPALPPRLAEATPAAIRRYLQSPPDYSKLKKSELARMPEMTEAEKLSLQAEIAENNRLAEEARTAREIRAEELRAMNARPGVAPVESPVVPETPGNGSEPVGAGAEENIPDRDDNPGGCNMVQAATILQLAEAIGMSDDVLGQSIAKRTSSPNIESLSAAQADEVIGILRQRAAQLKK